MVWSLRFFLRATGARATARADAGAAANELRGGSGAYRPRPRHREAHGVDGRQVLARDRDHPSAAPPRLAPSWRRAAPRCAVTLFQDHRPCFSPEPSAQPTGKPPGPGRPVGCGANWEAARHRSRKERGAYREAARPGSSRVECCANWEAARP